MKKLPVVLTSVVAVLLVAVIAVLGVKMKKNSEISVAEVADLYGDSATAENTETSAEGYIPYNTEETTKSGFWGLFSGNDEETASAVPETVTSAVNQLSTTVALALSGTTGTTAATTAAASTAVSTTYNSEAFSKVFTMPKSPKYIPPDVDIDFSTASLASYKYDPDGNYYYTDDKNAWQKGFGYNKIYDSLAIATAMYYDTVRTNFTYEGKDWLIQIWKGQYGYYFVGEEIGIYTKTQGSNSNTYACADKSDWMKMEMCFIWDENKTGDYEPIFTRPYTEYWWCTGFVVGFESKNCMKDREQFRMIAHITFKDTEMAQLFCSAFEKNGFRRVSKLDNNVKDTFVQVGPDVAFVWQSINQNKI